MNFSFPEKIQNLIIFINDQKDRPRENSNYYLTIIEALAYYKYIIDNVNDENILCLFNKKENKIKEEIGV